MARILTDESTLTRKLKSLSREDRLLSILSRVEAVVAGLLLLAGIAWYLMKGGAGLLVVGIVAAFLCVAHIMKTRENRREHRSVQAGLKGEVTVTQVLERELGKEAYILNDVMVRKGWHTAQIDHVVVSPKGIFLIETKNWRGKLSGDVRDKQWTQNKGKGIPPIKVSSPVMQNERHRQVFSGFLKARHVEWPDLHTVLVMMNPNCEWDITGMEAPVLKPGEVADFISYHPSSKSYTEKEVDSVLTLLVKTR